MAKVDLYSTDSEVLEQTLKELLGKEYLLQPLSAINIITAIELLPFTMLISFSKITGKWICSNGEIENPLKPRTDFAGVNFIVADFTMEKACARAIHYYFHLKLKDKKA